MSYLCHPPASTDWWDQVGVVTGSVEVCRYHLCTAILSRSQFIVGVSSGSVGHEVAPADNRKGVDSGSVGHDVARPTPVAQSSSSADDVAREASTVLRGEKAA